MRRSTQEQAGAYNSAAHSDNIGVIMLACRLGCEYVADNRRAYAGTLLAAIEIPMPVPQIRMPLSHSPLIMLCATGKA